MHKSVAKLRHGLRELEDELHHHLFHAVQTEGNERSRRQRAREIQTQQILVKEIRAGLDESAAQSESLPLEVRAAPQKIDILASREDVHPKIKKRLAELSRELRKRLWEVSHETDSPVYDEAVRLEAQRYKELSESGAVAKD